MVVKESKRKKTEEDSGGKCNKYWLGQKQDKEMLICQVEHLGMSGSNRASELSTDWVHIESQGYGVHSSDRQPRSWSAAPVSSDSLLVEQGQFEEEFEKK